MILGILYESYIHPLTILSTLPSAGLGALLALRAGGLELNVIGIIAIILLIGIVKKNGIMIVDVALKLERDNKMSAEDAVREASHQRLRPILMTTACAMLGGVPMDPRRGPWFGVPPPPRLGHRGGAAGLPGADLVLDPGYLHLPGPPASAVAAGGQEAGAGVSGLRPDAADCARQSAETGGGGVLSRIVYVIFAPSVLSGGTKVSFRHVEALNELGFDAVIRIVGGGTAPAWFRHAAPIETEAVPLAAEDILVLPEDDPNGLRLFAGAPNRKIVFCQNPLFATEGVPRLAPLHARQYRHYMACSAGVAAWIARFLDYDHIAVTPGFADERLFRPSSKEAVIACIPRKRPLELSAIRHMFSRLYRGATAWRWDVLESVTEEEVARSMGRAAVFLSLNRFEGLALTTVEAMASECLVAGFTGIGPREYASPINGLWVEEDDCEACARVLVRAVEMAEANAGAAALMRHAGRVTADQWSRAAFLRALEVFWRTQLEGPPKKSELGGT